MLSDVLRTIDIKSAHLKVMGESNGFPQTKGVGKMYIGNVNNEKFPPEDIITWENTAGTTGGFQWFGWREESFANQNLRISFWIKFLGTIPPRSANFGIKVYNVVYDNWVETCKVDEWCFVEIEMLCGSSGDDYHVLMIFDSINQKQVVRISQFKIDILRKSLKSFSKENFDYQVNPMISTFFMCSFGLLCANKIPQFHRPRCSCLLEYDVFEIQQMVHPTTE